MNPKKDNGQFFTHPEVALFMAKLINPSNNEKIIDPACGEGEFLEKLYTLNSNVQLYGCEIDEDIYTSAANKVPTAKIFLHNGLYSEALYNNEIDISNEIKNEDFDAIIANPPFNSLTNKITDKNILGKFIMGNKENKIRKAQSIEVLFIERFIQLLKPSGRLCTVLPEGILSGDRYSYVRDWLYSHLSIDAIITLPKKGMFNSANVNTAILCAYKKPCDNPNDDVFYVRDISFEDFNLIYDYMARNNIFVRGNNCNE